MKRVRPWKKQKKAPLGPVDSARQALGLKEGAGAVENIFGTPLDMQGLPPTNQQRAIQSAQQLYEAEQQKLRETPGGKFYNEKPV